MLIVKNGGEDPLTFRLTLPSNAAFRIEGDCVKKATFDKITAAELAPGGSAVLTITLVPTAVAAEAAEAVDELLIRTVTETVHVPLAAVRDGRVPSGGEPTERRSAPTAREHWDEAALDSEDEEESEVVQQGASSARARAARALESMGGGKGGMLPLRPGEELEVVKLTPARCTENEELVYYQQLLKDDMKERQKIAAEAAAAEMAAAEKVRADAAAAAAARASTMAPPPPPVSQAAAANGSKVRVVQVNEPMVAQPSQVEPVVPPVSQRQVDAEAAVDDELAFYRSFIRGKQQSDAAATQQASAAAATDPAATASSADLQQSLLRADPAARVWAAGMELAQAEARRAIAAGTYFVVGGVVTDSRGRELGPVEEVLGPEFAEEGEVVGASSSSMRQDPAARVDPRDFGALHGAGLGALRDALSERGDVDELADEDDRDEGLERLAVRNLDTTGMGEVAPLTETRPFIAGGSGATASGVTTKDMGASGSPKKALNASMPIKGGGSKVASSAPKPTRKLTAAEMEANWDALTG